MKVFAISGLEGMTTDHLDIIAKNWQRRVSKDDVVIIADAIPDEFVDWVSELPGKILAYSEDPTPYTHTNIRKLTTKAVYYAGGSSPTGFHNNSRKGLIVAAGDENDYQHALSCAEAARSNNQDAFILVHRTPFYHGVSKDYLKTLEDGDVDMIVYGCRTGWEKCSQGRTGAVGNTSMSYRLVDATFLDGIITYLCDVDHAGYYHKDQERKAEREFGWELSDRRSDAPPVTIVRGAPMGESLYGDIPVPPEEVSSVEEVTVTQPQPKPVPLQTGSVAVSEAEKTYQSYCQKINLLSGLVRKQDLITFQRTHPTIYGEFKLQFAAWPKDTTLAEIIEFENSHPAYPSTSSAGWRQYLRSLPPKQTFAAVHHTQEVMWDRWSELWESYPAEITISQALEAETEAPSRLSDEAPCLSDAELKQLLTLSKAYAGRSLIDISVSRPEYADLLERAGQEMDVKSMNEVHEWITANVTGAIEEPVQTQSDREFCDLYYSFPNFPYQTLASLRRNTTWWNQWGKCCSLFADGAKIEEMQEASKHPDAWLELLWELEGGITVKELHAYHADAIAGFSFIGAFKQTVTVDEILADCLGQQSATATPTSATTTVKTIIQKPDRTAERFELQEEIMQLDADDIDELNNELQNILGRLARLTTS